MFDSFFNAIFGSLISWSPLYGLIIISFILTLIITLLYKLLTNQEMIKNLREEIKDHQTEFKAHKDNPEKLMEVQKRVMEKNLKLMTHSMKPTLFTFIPLIIIFSWLRNTYADQGAIFLGLSWLWTYIIFSIIFSFSLRKIIKVY